jgi:putative spermidine/putrescine transport system permease protein
MARVLAHAYVGAVCVFILAPIVVVALASFQYGQYLAFPIERYSLRWYAEALGSSEWRDAFWTSMTLAAQAAALATVAGVSAALALHSHEFRGKQLVSVLLLGPLLLPELLMGIALLFLFGGLGLSGSYVSLLLAHVLMTMPYVVRLVSSAFAGTSRNLEEAAMTLGANEVRTFIAVTLPLIAPGIRGGLIFAFMVSYNNFLVSLFLIAPGVSTLPVKIFSHLEFVADPTIAAVATVFIVLTFALTLVLELTVKVNLLPGVDRRRQGTT